jgi:flagellar biogenesis protein FliO
MGAQSGRTPGHELGTGTFSVLWPLLAVLATIVVLTMAVRKYFPRMNRLRGGSAVNVLATQYLSSKQSLSLVRLGRRVVLLGVTPDRISAVAEVCEPEEVAEIVASVERKKPDSFTAALARLRMQDSDERLVEEITEEDAPIPADRLARTGAGVRELAARIRALSNASAEPT